MKIKKEKISQLIFEIDSILESIKIAEIKNKSAISRVCTTYRKSAKNLIHYTKMREHDLRTIQKKLGNLGMSRFANAGGHVKASLLNTKFILNSLIDIKPKKVLKNGLSIKNEKTLLANHTKELLGFRSNGRRVRIMVTQPTNAAHDYHMVHEMVKNGMNCARINCAHDGPIVWKKIISNVKRASKSQGRKVIITMDLAGPKIRTGAIRPGAKVKKFSPERDPIGKILNPANIVLISNLSELIGPNYIPLDSQWIKRLGVGERITLTDTRGKRKSFKVTSKGANQVTVNCYETIYISTGSILKSTNDSHGSTVVGELPPVEQSILLRNNDILTIVKEDILGEPAQFGKNGDVIKQARISCQPKEVVDRVKKGENILFDDGKIEGKIISTSSDSFDIKIIRSKENGSRLKAEKGINFPTTDLRISGLTKKDKKDLQFVANHAHVVSFSFVNNKEDVEELLKEIENLGALNKLSIILKIETRRAFDNLMEILLTAMKVNYVGVMIARGDLAVETGWDNIGRVQKEILSLCNAAHIPVVWATQVLENLAKKGLPSRSEITDATRSLKAECVMLNKGPFINDAISLLDKILRNMEDYNEKNESMLPQLEKLMN